MITSDAQRAVSCNALLGRESRELAGFRAKWIGSRVSLQGEEATVVGVCDDGHRCDYDARRKYKSTGELIVRRDVANTDDYWAASLVTVLPNSD